MKTMFVTTIAAAMLAGCGTGSGSGSGTAIPAEFAGTWSSDCTAPFVTFADDGVTIHPNATPYALKGAKVAGANFLVSYVNPDVPGTVTETYAVAGDTLRLASTAVDGKTVATWTKRPMTRCS